MGEVCGIEEEGIGTDEMDAVGEGERKEQGRLNEKLRYELPTHQLPLISYSTLTVRDEHPRST